VAAKTSDPPNSPYGSIKSSVSEHVKQWAQNAMHPSEVAKVILQAITSDDPDFRFLVGNDTTMVIEARKNMSDREFRNLIKKQSGIDNNTLAKPQVTK
jgi:hypothetical protein